MATMPDNAPGTFAEEHPALKAVLDASGGGVLAVSSDGKVLYCNRRFRRIWSISGDAPTPVDAEGLLAQVRPRLADPERFDLETSRINASDRESEDRLRLPDGREVTRRSFPLQGPGKIRGRAWLFQEAGTMGEKERDPRIIRLCLDHTSLAIFRHGADARLLDANRTACIRLGYTREELLRLSVFDIDPTMTPEKWPQTWQRMCEEGSITIAAAHRKKDGTDFPVEVTANLFEFEGEKFSVSFVRDLTEENRTKGDLRLARFCFDQASIGIFLIEASGRIRDVNNQACSYLGYTRKELCALSIPDINPTITPEMWRGYWDAISVKRTNTFTTVHRKKNGETVPVEICANLLEFEGIHYSVAFVQDIGERKRTEKELRITEFCMNAASFGIFRIDDTGRIISANDHACNVLGYSREELTSLTVFDVDRTVTRAFWTEHRKKLRNMGKRVIETAHTRKDGTSFPVEVLVNFLEYEGEAFSISFARDISERKEAEAHKAMLESQLRQAQKMEAIGRLAGGIAHDFNNMLTIIQAYAELAKVHLPGDNPVSGYLSQIQGATDRSREITKQLLGFSRRQIISPKILELNGLIDGLKRTLSRIIGEDVTILFHPDEELCNIKFDPSQIEQIVMNLVINARDAMPDGGAILIETRNVTVDASQRIEKPYIVPGRYALLSVADEGVGMDAETRANIFEPFFTTKPPGKGTGLGLATVYGIVKQNNGFINVYSEPGQGSTFRVYIPRTGEAKPPRTETPKATVRRGSGRVLLVEDDTELCDIIVQMLALSGYKVMAASSPEEALLLIESHPGGPEKRFDLLLTDVVMPGMSGVALRDRVVELAPDIKVLFMSGYTDNFIAHHGILDENVNFIPKPFTINDLIAKVKEAIG